jgi:hypothetical protein
MKRQRRGRWVQKWVIEGGVFVDRHGCFDSGPHLTWRYVWRPALRRQS